MYVEAKVSGVVLDPLSNTPVVILKEVMGKRVLPIWIGMMEANAIVAELESMKFPRPMTHDLLRDVLGTLKCKVTKVIVSDLKDNTYYAEIYLETQDGREEVVDSRPSDAIALALRTSSPILIKEEVLEKSSASELFSVVENEEEREQLKKKWEEILQQISPDDFTKYKM